MCLITRTPNFPCCCLQVIATTTTVNTDQRHSYWEAIFDSATSDVVACAHFQCAVLATMMRQACVTWLSCCRLRSGPLPTTKSDGHTNTADYKRVHAVEGATILRTSGEEASNACVRKRHHADAADNKDVLRLRQHKRGSGGA